MTLARFVAQQLSPAQILEIEKNVVDDFSELAGLQSVIVFGSAANHTMSTASDIDVVLIFDTVENTALGRRSAPNLRKKAVWPMDLLCVDKATFSKKSEVGGVFFVARTEGREIWGKKE